MNQARLRILWVMALLAVCLVQSPARAADDTPASAPGSGAVTNQHPTSVSPVEKFRKLLAMTPAEREKFLIIYPPETRERILEKLQEYQLLPPDFREWRLRVTELRWYLLPLLKTPATNRAERLKSIPEPYRKLVSNRLREWDIWPPTLKDEVLEYESTLHYFVAKGAVVKKKIEAVDLPERQRPELERKLAHFLAMPAAQRQQLYACFQRYFELSNEEKQNLMDSLSETERQKTEQALTPIEKWSKPQRVKYLVAFRQFANMSKDEREQFMINAAKWEKMSPEERQACRDVVKQMANSPPWPIGLVPPHARPAGVTGAIPTGGTNPAQRTAP